MSMIYIDDPVQTVYHLSTRIKGSYYFQKYAPVNFAASVPSRGRKCLKQVVSFIMRKNHNI